MKRRRKNREQEQLRRNRDSKAGRCADLKERRLDSGSPTAREAAAALVVLHLETEPEEEEEADSGPGLSVAAKGETGGHWAGCLGCAGGKETKPLAGGLERKRRPGKDIF